MRKLMLSLAMVCVMAFALVSCKTNTPKSVATSWLTSFYHLDFEAAKQLSTDNTKKMLDMFDQLTKKEPDSSKQQLKKIKIDIKDVKEDGDKATVSYVTSDNPQSTPETLRLVKVNGKWLAEYSKQDQMNEGGANQPGTTDPNPADASAPDSSAPPASQQAPVDTTMAK